MTLIESALYGLMCLVAAAGLIAWAYRSQGKWARGDYEHRAMAFRVPPSAPGQKRILAALLLIVAGIVLVAPYVSGLF
jgi:hypothetical protein